MGSKPFHKSIIACIQKVDARGINYVISTIVGTTIPEGHEEIIKAIKAKFAVLNQNLSETANSVIVYLLAEHQHCVNEAGRLKTANAKGRLVGASVV